DLGLAETDVAADQPVHRARRLEVLLHGLDRALLVVRLAKREAGLQLLQPLRREVERDARGVLPSGVEGEEIAGELAHARANAILEELPRLAAELRERGRCAVGSDVP